MKTHRRKQPRAGSRGALPAAEMPSGAGKARIGHQEILLASTAYPRFLEIYRHEVLGQRTRTISLLGKKNPARILHTLLGYEVQASYKRIQCPDLVTARYIRLFSEFGCRSIQLPYDPTETARLIPEFEALADAIVAYIRKLFPHDSRTQAYVIRKTYEIIRRQLTGKAGA